MYSLAGRPRRVKKMYRRRRMSLNFARPRNVSTEHLITIKKRSPSKSFPSASHASQVNPLWKRHGNTFLRCARKALTIISLTYIYFLKKSLSSISPLSLFPEPVELPYNTYFYLFL